MELKIIKKEDQSLALEVPDELLQQLTSQISSQAEAQLKEAQDEAEQLRKENVVGKKLAPAGDMTPTAAASTQTGKQPASDPTQEPRQLISEIPLPDVQTHYLGAGMEYAKFSSPIDVGDGFKQ